MDFLVGDKLCNIADTYVYIPGWTKFINKNIDAGINVIKTDPSFSNVSHAQFEKSKVIYIHLQYIINLIKFIIGIKNDDKYILITHSGDCSKNLETYKYYLDKYPNKIKCILSQNIDEECDNLIPIPLGIKCDAGIPNHAVSNKIILERLISVKPKKDILVYLNMSVNTNIQKRKPCFDYFKDKKWTLVEINKTEEQYCTNISKAFFCPCPEGNGIDTLRFWECIYLKTIPIVLNTKFNNFWKNKGCTMLIVEKWEDVNEEFLKGWYKEHAIREITIPEIALNGYYSSIVKAMI